MNNSNSDIQYIENILSKSPISITKNEYARLNDLILTHQLYIYVMPLLRMQEFYLHFNIPLIIRSNIDLLSYFDQERINFLEIVGYVFFNFGNQMQFFSNLILFKYKKFPRLKEKSQLQLHTVIGEIIGPLWWHYELFKLNARSLNQFLYHQLAFTIQRHQQNRDQHLNIYTISKISKYYQLIINNSIEQFQGQEDLSKSCDSYIQNLLKIELISFDNFLKYLQYSSWFSLKRRVIYNKLLFYFWQASKQAKQPTTQNTIKSESLIVNKDKEVKPFSSSILKSSIKFQSAIFQKPNSSIVASKNLNNLLQIYLNENIDQFSEQLNDENLENQFNIIVEQQQEKVSEINNFEEEDLQIFLSSDQFHQKIKQIMNDICVESLIPILQGSRKKQLLYTIILQQDAVKIHGNQTIIKNIIQNNKRNENKIVTDEFYQFHSLMQGKKPIEQLELINLVCYEKQFTKSQQSIFWRCLQINLKDHQMMIELSLRLKSIQTVYDCQFHRLWLANIDSNEWQLLNQSVHQQCLIEVFYLILQCLVENEKDSTDWQKIIVNLLQLIDVRYSQDVILNIFKFSLIDIKFPQFMNLISLPWPINFSNDQVDMIMHFLEKVLFLKQQQQKLLILQGFSMLVPFSFMFQIQFLIDEVNQSPSSLISYVKIKYLNANNSIKSQSKFNQQYNQDIITIAQELHKNDFQFYKLFISSEDTPGFDLQLITEISISQEQATLFNKRLVAEVQPLSLQEYQQQIHQLIISHKISNRMLMKELDEQILVKISKQFSEKEIFDYTVNQKQFIETYVDNKISNLKVRIRKEIELVEMKIQQYFDWKNMILNLNKNFKETLLSDQYFQEDFIKMVNCSKMFDYIISSTIKKKQCIGISLLKQEYQQIFLAFQPNSQIDNTTKEEFINKFRQVEEVQLEITVLKSFLNSLEIQMFENSREFQLLLKELNDSSFDELIQDLKINLIGCLETCPICRRKCDQNVQKKHKHKCQLGHQLRSMGGVIVDGKLSLKSCEELKDNYLVFDSQSNQYKKWAKLKLQYKKWSFETSSSNELQKQQLMNIWNDNIGMIICNRLNIQFKPKFDDEYQMLSHYIFVIDESLSMAGQNWKNVVNATQQSLQELSQMNNVRITIIQFSDDARLVVGQQSPEIINVEQQISQLVMAQAGGTDFETAFQLLFYAIYSNINQFERQIILFYTDGDADYPQLSMNLFAQLQECYIKNISILLCSEQIFSKTLNSVQNLLASKLYTSRLLQSVKSNQLPQIWLQEVSDKY